MDEYNLSSIFGTGDETNVLFFINPFSRGTIFDHKEIDSFLKELNLPPEKHYYEPCDNLTIVRRMLANLSHSFEKLGYLDKVDELQELREIVA